MNDVMRAALLMLGPLALNIVFGAIQVEAAEEACPELSNGHYAVWGKGWIEGKSSGDSVPTARLMEERWLSSGLVEGVLIERVGREERRSPYQGRRRASSGCVVTVERHMPWGQEEAEVVVDRDGRPVYSLLRHQSDVLSLRWMSMETGLCKSSSLNGVVLSQQMGLSQQRGEWYPNVVIQREQWNNGAVDGVALSSYHGKSEEASYRGRLTMAPNSCWGSLREVDSKGNRYHYDALIVADRSGADARGYIYLQSDPDDLTVGWLVRE